MFIEDGDVSGMTLSLVDLAGLELALGRRERAFRLTGAAEEASRRTGAGLASTSMQARYFPDVPKEPAAGSPDRVAWDEGMRMTLEEAIAYALETPADEPAPG